MTYYMPPGFYLASSEAITYPRRRVDRLQRFWLSLAIVTGLIVVMVAAGLLGVMP